MTPFTTLTSVVAPLPRDNVDTDAIIPSREMKSTGRTGLADGLFAPWRYVEGRTPDPEFVLNRPEFAHAQILASGANFGCGSSREHAVWALLEWGIRAVIAESFAPIFRNNCIRNGVLPVVLPKMAVAEIAGRQVMIDLSAQTVAGHRFDIDAEPKAMLLEGLDAIDLTLKHRAAISAWTAKDRAERPWVYLPPQLAGEGTRDAQRRGGGVRRPRRLSDEAVAEARRLRRQLSPAERLLWTELRRRPSGLKWRRQHPSPPYTLDFYCPAAKLCVEVDGGGHDSVERIRLDERRDGWMRDRGISTLRVSATDVHRNLEGVMGKIAAVASERAPLPHASRGSPPQQAGEAAK